MSRTSVVQPSQPAKKIPLVDVSIRFDGRGGEQRIDGQDVARCLFLNRGVRWSTLTDLDAITYDLGEVRTLVHLLAVAGDECEGEELASGLRSIELLMDELVRRLELAQRSTGKLASEYRLELPTSADGGAR